MESLVQVCSSNIDYIQVCFLDFKNFLFKKLQTPPLFSCHFIFVFFSAWKFKLFKVLVNSRHCRWQRNSCHLLKCFDAKKNISFFFLWFIFQFQKFFSYSNLGTFQVNTSQLIFICISLLSVILQDFIILRKENCCWKVTARENDFDEANWNPSVNFLREHESNYLLACLIICCLMFLNDRQEVEWKS